MDLAQLLYADCSGVLNARPHRRARGLGALASEPMIWESVLLTVHFLCVIHAVHERDVFRKLADRWRARRKSGSSAESRDVLLTETNTELTALEEGLHQGVIKPLYDQLDAAKKAVHEILSAYATIQSVDPETASRIVSSIAGTLERKTSPRND